MSPPHTVKRDTSAQLTSAAAAILDNTCSIYTQFFSYPATDAVDSRTPYIDHTRLISCSPDARALSIPETDTRKPVRPAAKTRRPRPVSLSRSTAAEIE